VRESISQQLGGAAGIYKIPFLTFTIRLVNTSRVLFTEIRASMTRAMGPSMAVFIGKIFVRLSFFRKTILYEIFIL